MNTSPALGFVSVQVTVLRPIPDGGISGPLVVVVLEVPVLAEGPPTTSETIPTSTATMRMAARATAKRRRR